MLSLQKNLNPSFFAPLSTETHFFIVRHGQSEGNALRIVQGRRDLPLDETGRGQAKAIAPWLASQGIGLVMASPLKRAAETAGVIAARSGLPAPILDAKFLELDTGIFSGLSLDDAQRQYPEAYRQFERESWDGVPGAESSAALYERALAAWTLLVESAQAKSASLAVVSHGGFIQWLVRSTFGVRSWMPLLPTGNCGVFELVATPRPGCEAPHLLWKRLNFQVYSGLEAVPQVF